MPDTKPLTVYLTKGENLQSSTGLDQHRKAPKQTSWFWKNIIPSIISGIVAAVVASLILSVISEGQLRYRSEQNLIKSVHSLCIGSNKEWVDSLLNPPTFSREIGDYMECTYITDIAAVRVLYEIQTYGCRAYFVTLLKNNIIDTISLPDVYSWITDEKPLGTVSYHGIIGEPTRVAGYVSDGVGYTFYAEEYPMNSSGNYYRYILVSLSRPQAKKLS